MTEINVKIVPFIAITRTALTMTLTNCANYICSRGDIVFAYVKYFLSRSFHFTWKPKNAEQQSEDGDIKIRQQTSN